MKRIGGLSLMVLCLSGLATIVLPTCGCVLTGFREIVLAQNTYENAPLGSLQVINDLLWVSGLRAPATVTTNGVKIGKITGISADLFDGTYVSDTGDPRDIKKALTDNDDKTSPFDVPGRIIAINAVGAAVSLYTTGLVAPRNLHIGYDGNSLVFFDLTVRDADDRKVPPGPTNQEDHTGIFSTPIGVAASFAGANRKELYSGVGFEGTVQDLDVAIDGSFLVTESGFGAEAADDPDTVEDETLPKSAIIMVTGRNLRTVHEKRGAEYGSIASDVLGTIAVVDNNGEDTGGNKVLQILSISATGQGVPKVLFTQNIPNSADVAKDDFVVEKIGQIEFGLWGNILAVLEGHIAGEDGDTQAERQPAFQLVSINTANAIATPVTLPTDTIEHTSGGFALR